MAAPKGNRNAAKAKEWEAAIRHALENYQTSSIQRGLALREIAKKVVEAAVNGEWRAIEEIGNRIDGKASQQIEHSGDIGLRHTSELTEAELERIASGSSTGDSEAPQGAPEPVGVH